MVMDKGSGVRRDPERRISDIARFSSSPYTKTRKILSIAEFFEAKKILELGTSFGLTSLYLSTIPESKLTTFEADKSIADIARLNFQTLHRENINLIRGDLDITLAETLDKCDKIDMAFIDANHRLKPTLEYYELLLRKCHQDSVLIFDDIHYSREMEQAWNTIIDKVEVTLSIDLFDIGVIKIDPNHRKSHFILGF